MSTPLKTIDKSPKDGGNLDITRFYGGKQRGVCLQLTQDTGYVQLTQEDIDVVSKLAKELKNG